jgi:hypothetical protein
MTRRAGTVALTSGRVVLSLAAVLFLVLALAPAAGGVQSHGGQLKPSPVGEGQCYYHQFSNSAAAAQIAESDTTCPVAEKVVLGSESARGSPYQADGFTCAATKEGTGSTWASAWGGTYYAYGCAKGSEQVAFNWGSDYTYTGTGATTTTPPRMSDGRLLPSPVGDGQCTGGYNKDRSVYAQIAVSGVSCTVAESVIPGSDVAKGSRYTSHGFICTAKTEGLHTDWSGAWGGTYHAYDCVKGSEQLAFNWGTDYTY